MDTAVPTIEVAHDADAFCAGRPHGEVNAAHVIERNPMGAEFFVSVVVAALAHKVEIKVAEDDRKRIRIENFKGIAEVCASLNLVTARRGRRGLPRRPGGFEEAFRAKFGGVGDFRGGKRSAFDGGRLQRDTGFLSPTQEKTD